MALIKCPKCSHQVEPNEHECPKCGVIFKKYQEGVVKAQKAFAEKAKRSHNAQSIKLTKCGACANTISKLAPVCPRCGEPQKVQPPERNDESKPAATFLALKFTHFITPQLVRIIYIIVLVAGLIGCIGGVISSFSSPFDPLQIVLTVISYLLFVLGTRIGCESALLLFKIEENTRSWH